MCPNMLRMRASLLSTSTSATIVPLAMLKSPVDHDMDGWPRIQSNRTAATMLTGLFTFAMPAAFISYHSHQRGGHFMRWLILTTLALSFLIGPTAAQEK